MPASNRVYTHAGFNARLFDVLGMAHNHDIDMKSYERYFRHLGGGMTDFYDTMCKGYEKADVHGLCVEAILAVARDWPDSKRSVVRDALVRDLKLGEHQITPDVCDAAIDLGLHMWLVVDCSAHLSVGHRWSWPEDMSIQTYVDAWFTPGGAHQEEPERRFPRKFTAARLRSHARIKVNWTDFLSEHLVYDADNDRVSIFRHKQWLQDVLTLRDGKNVTVHSNNLNNNLPTARMPSQCGLSTELLKETLLSIELLFPLTDPATTSLLKGDQDVETNFQVSVRPSDKPRRAPTLREFNYWREQLLDLSEEYQAPIRHAVGIWRDRRNQMAFWTFWIGLVIFFSTLAFGVVASILAGITLDAQRSSVKTTN